MATLYPPPGKATPTVYPPPMATVYPPATATPAVHPPPMATVYPPATATPAVHPPPMATVYPPRQVQGARVGAPPLQGFAQATSLGTWTTGLFDCDDDIDNFCVTFWCPCITFGQVAEILDRGSTSCGASGGMYTLVLCLLGCPCFYSCFYRTRLRAQYALPEAPLPDFLAHCIFESCALSQAYRELRNRGFDLDLGWHANVQMKTRGVTTPPTVVPGMVR